MADNHHHYNQPFSNDHLQDAQGFQSVLLSSTQMLTGEEKQRGIVKKKENVMETEKYNI